ncbi:MAG TPA: tripartite tricarboxylate transporter TctB family protein [Candidatus Ruania gallistercoris]|uniref:Tripartite tricarboxylate transporter TctB family protein n=1 Tax=Candidatus Ruania gallistercoris TaxID=2838746 RepID=A0A9D2J3M3_9MICO|nr:tripartite tricarboxylate transporter TctB family protein [Candidatus Ruania gallistercoris]
MRQARVPAGGVVFVALGILTLVGLRGLPWFADSGAVGPAAFPGVCGILIGLLGLVQIGSALIAGRAQPASPAPAPDGDDGSVGDVSTEGEGKSEATALQAVIAWVAVLAAAILLPRIGLLITVPLLSLFLLTVVGKKRIHIAAIYSVALTVVVYLVFVMALKVPLPIPPGRV